MNIHLAQFEWVHALFLGAQDDLVIYVGEIHHVAYFISSIFEITANDVEDQRRHGMPDMRLGIHGGAADVHFHLAGFEGLEFLNLAG